MLALPVTEISQVAEARRAGTAMARQLALDEADTGKVALIVTEAATNLAKHATGG
jgi:anti-sigma regulatory factor (Ser/Thr protein kinase)